MSTPHTEELKPEFSIGEKERRWSFVRESMRQEGLAAIVTYGDSLNWIPIHFLTYEEEHRFYTNEGDCK